MFSTADLLPVGGPAATAAVGAHIGAAAGIAGQSAGRRQGHAIGTGCARVERAAWGNTAAAAGQTFIMNLEQTTQDLTWATVVNLLGLPADPRWGNVVLGEMRKDKLIRRLDGIGCNPAVVIGSREDFMTRMGQARALGLLPFPAKNGPVVWPHYTVRDVLALQEKHEECSGSVSA